MNRPPLVEEKPAATPPPPRSGDTNNLCPKCHEPHPQKGRVCNGCGYFFVLDPHISPFLGDKEWFGLLERATHQSSLFITQERLYAVFCHQWRRQNPPPRSMVFLLFAATAALIWIDQPELAILAFLAGLTTWFAPFHKPPGSGEFQLAMQSMDRAGHGHGMVLQSSGSSLYNRTTLPQHLPDQAQKYKRILVVERRVQTDLFMLNGFDLDGQTLVLGAGGYPQNALEQAHDLLIQNPGMPVFVLHDSGLKGSRLKKFLKESGFLPLDGHPLYDLGLSENQSVKLFKALGPMPNDTRSLDMLDYNALAAATALAMNAEADPVSVFDRAIKKSAE